MRSIYINISAMVIMAWILADCSVYKRYDGYNMDLSTDSLYRQPVADTVSLASLSWRELFTDSCLQSLIYAALQENSGLAVAKLQIEEAQATLTSAKHAYLPALQLSTQAGTSHFDSSVKRTYNIGTALTWEADIFARITNSRLAGEAGLNQSVAYAQAVQTQLVATVADAYYTLLMFDEQLDIMRLTLDNWTTTITMLQALVDAGKTNDVAVHQARANKTALEAQIATVEESISTTENALCSLLGQMPQTIDRGTLDGQQFPDSVSTGLPLLLLSNRPDVRQREAALAEAYYTTNIARAAFYPTLTLTGNLGFTNSGGSVVSNPGKWLSSALAGLTAPLFNRGVNTATLKIAKVRQQEAEKNFRQALLDAAVEVNDALASWQKADKRIIFDTCQVRELEAAVDKTTLLVRYTSANYLEVLTAQQALLQARLTLAQDRTDKIQSVIRLYHALGGGEK